MIWAHLKIAKRNTKFRVKAVKELAHSILDEIERSDLLEKCCDHVCKVELQKYWDRDGMAHYQSPVAPLVVYNDSADSE